MMMALPSGPSTFPSALSDGTFVPAGYFLTVDGGSTAALAELQPSPEHDRDARLLEYVTAIPEPRILRRLGRDCDRRIGRASPPNGRESLVGLRSSISA